MCSPPTSSEVRVTRRLALHGAWAAPAVWMLSRTAHARAAVQPDDVDAVLRRWAERTAELVEQGDPNEDAHLHGLCADLARLDPQAFPPRIKVTYDKGGMKSGPVYAASPFIVLQFDLEPGAVIRAHNHVGWNFVSMGVRGEATVRNFEVSGEAPEPGTLDVDFHVREVASTVLTTGRTSSLTRTRANIHHFQAGEQGATFLDFGVHLEEPGRGPRSSSVLEFEAKPLDAGRRIHAARWLGNVYAKQK